MATAAVGRETEDQRVEELGALCSGLLRDRENDRQEMARLNARLDKLVGVVRFGLGVLLDGFEVTAAPDFDLTETPALAVVSTN